MVGGEQFRREESVDKCELTQPRLFCFGLGYTGLRVARAAQARGWRVAGTCRDASKAIALRREGIATFLFDGRSPLSGAAAALAGTTHLLCAVPPDAESDPVLRLPGIYGPQGRSPIDALLAGRARRIVKPGHVFNRIHVDDLVAVLGAAMERDCGGDRNGPHLYNVCDDEPAPADEVLVYAANLLGMQPPPAEPFDTAALSDFARHFYAESRRNARPRRRAPPARSERSAGEPGSSFTSSGGCPPVRPPALPAFRGCCS